MGCVLDTALENQINKAVNLLKQGELVVFPTETVYGLGADASNQDAVLKIYELKKRPKNHPLIVHLASMSMIENWVYGFNKTACQLAQAFWPGPMTLILKKSPSVLNCVTGGYDTVAIRIPSHPIAQRLLQLFNGGIAAPSANSFGKLSPTQARHVHKELGPKVKMVLDGGRCQCGLESTIIDVTGDQPNILRYGAISAKAIEQVIGNTQDLNKASTIAAPGKLEAHYAPNTKMRIVSSDRLLTFIKQQLEDQKTVSVLARQSALINHPSVTWIEMPKEAEGYAYELYEALHCADEKQRDMIIIENIPRAQDWLAIHDRLKKAECGSQISK